ncbi:MAG TPA: glycoside hydrolase family 16 protein [Kineosporiaceae bacterium]|nr:glycoside hydrolase family 16 protein [Kineosporiaceae bacterium]
MTMPPVPNPHALPPRGPVPGQIDRTHPHDPADPTAGPPGSTSPAHHADRGATPRRPPARRPDRGATPVRPRPRHVGSRGGRLTAAIAVPLAALLVAGVVAQAGAAQTTVPTAPAGWTTVWSDDFTGSAGTGVNTADWMYATGTGYPGGAANWGTGEVETMTSSTTNVALDGAGHLAITPVRDAAGRWTSGRIETQRTDFAAPAGGVLRVEASIQQPNVTAANGAGYWPAFWMLGAAARPAGATNWPGIGEIDILEDVNARSSVFGTLHCGVVSGGPCNETTGIGSGEHACPGCQTGFHTYAMEYDRSVSPEQIRWYLDGARYFAVNANQVDATTWANAVQHGFFIILNVAMGGAFPAALGAGTPTAATVSGQPMLVDYVAAYTRPGGGPSPTTTSPSPTPSGSRDAYTTIRAESFDAESGTGTQPTGDVGGGNNVGWIANGDWLLYRGVDFGATPATQFQGRVASGAAGGVSGLVEVRLDSRTGPVVASFAVANTGGWQTWRTVPANLSAVTGVHDVYLTFSSGQPADFVNVNWFTFTH